MEESRSLIPIGGGRGLNLEMIDTARSLGDLFFQTGLFPDVRNAAQATFKIVAGWTYGWSPAYSMQNVYIIQAQKQDGTDYPPSVEISAKSMGGLVRRSERYEFRVIKLDNVECLIEFRHDNIIAGDSRWTIEDAAKAGLVERGKRMYVKYPRAMLFSGAMRNGVRMFCADLLQGYNLDPVAAQSMTADMVEFDGDAIVGTHEADAEIIDGEVESSESDSHAANGIEASGGEAVETKAAGAETGKAQATVVSDEFIPSVAVDLRPWPVETVREIAAEYRKWIVKHPRFGAAAQRKASDAARGMAVGLMTEAAGKGGDEFRHTLSTWLFGKTYTSAGTWWGHQAGFVIWWLRDPLVPREEKRVASEFGKAEAALCYRAAVVGAGQAELEI